MSTAAQQLEMIESLLGSALLDVDETGFVANVAKSYHRHHNDASAITEAQRERIELI